MRDCDTALKRIKMSVSRPGLSDITIEFKDRYSAAEMPDIFDELRRKVTDVRRDLPPGAGEPMVIDDFGDVYGVYLMLTGQGYSWRDLYDTADALKRELVLVPGVRKVSIDGVQEEVVYVDISRARLGELGICPKQLAAVLGSQNSVVDAGNMPLGDEYLRLSPTGAYGSVQAIGDTLIGSDEGRLVRLRDVAEITRAYREVPRKLYYVNGEPGLSLGISMAAGENVVEVGRALRGRFEELRSSIPVGMHLEAVYSQPTEVENSVAGFIISVAQAIAIVIVVLLLFMGLRVGVIIGAVLLITVAGTLLFMHLYGIELQRISLGALVIALPSFLVFGNPDKLPATGLQWGILAWLGLAASGLGLYLWNRGGCQVDAGTLAIMNNALVPAGLLVNLLIWNRDADLGRLALGGLVIAFSLWVNNRFRRQALA